MKIINHSPHILLIGNFLSRHGMGRAVGEDLSERLQASGWQVISTSHQRYRFLRLFDMLVTAWSKNTQYQVALVEVYSGKAFLWAEMVSLLLKIQKKPLILALHGGNLPEFSRLHPLRMKLCLDRADYVVSPSEWIAESLRKFRKEISVIRNGIDISHYPYSPRVECRPVLCWLRAFHNIYQPWVAVEVLHKVSNAYPNIRLLMVGPDKGDGSFERTKSLAEKYGMLSRVEFIGGVKKSEVPAWMNRADIFLNTTSLESFGVSVVEAAACGLPVVTTNVGELSYLWKHEEDALLVPPGDADAMAEAVLRLLRDPELAERLSRNARRKVEAFDWSVVLPQWERLFEEITSYA